MKRIAALLVLLIPLGLAGSVRAQGEVVATDGGTGLGDSARGFAEAAAAAPTPSLTTAVQAAAACLPSPVTGDCRAQIWRVFFNLTSMTCEEFIWGGCEGGANNWATVEECTAVCSPGGCSLYHALCVGEVGLGDHWEGGTEAD